MNKKPPSEQYMTNVGDITAQAYQEALTDKALSYAYINQDIDAIAQACRDNKGAIIGITGQDNGSWRTAYPKPPIGSTGLWYHWLFCAGATIINGKKYLKVLNSWGESVGVFGVQYLGEEHIPWMFTPHVIVENTTVIPTFTHHFGTQLSYGMSGTEVTALQNALKAEGLFSVPASGYFGNLTLAAVKAFQVKYNIIPSHGFCGPLTCAKLNSIYDH